MKNVYIENFCRVLVEKNEGDLPPETKNKLVEDLYYLLQNMIGRKMVAALPEDIRRQYVDEFQRGSRRVSYQDVAHIFEQHIENPHEIMKEALKEFTALYLQNRPSRKAPSSDSQPDPT
jgi:hypothetical protein